MVDTTSQSLLQQLCSSPNEESWVRFARIYGPFVERILRKAGLDEHDAADVSQDVMEVLIGVLPTFRHNGRQGAFRTWLRRVTTNRLRTYRHAHKRADHLKLGSVIETLEDPNSDLVSEWNEEHRRHVLDGLLEVVDQEFSSSTICAFRRTFLESEQISEVAEQLGMSKNAVVVARSKVLKRLRQLGDGLVD